MKPILFNTDMVRAILECRKKVTRRLIKPIPKCDVHYYKGHWEEKLPLRGGHFLTFRPPYQVGDILYVREKWSMDALPMEQCTDATVYAADYTERELLELVQKHFRWRPSIHMPKDKARIFLRVTDIRAERLHQITADGALMEGVLPNTEPLPIGRREQYYRGCFAALWDTRTNDRETTGWDANPWVWVIRFERIDKPEVE